ncbi:MAG: hypothetical protein ACK6DM_15650 [Alphaproteobacteria bacterium]
MSFWLEQFVGLQLDKYAVVALLALALAWALRFAIKDIQWVYELDDQYAKFRLRNINRISIPKSAREFLDDMNAFEAERVDATRARSARLVLLGFVVPSFVLLIAINSHSWLFPGQCPLQPGACQPTLNEALGFVGFNYLQDIPSEILKVVGLADFPVHTNSDNWRLKLLAFFVRYDAVAHLGALAYFEVQVRRFPRANRADREKAEAIINSKVSASAEAAPETQSGIGSLQRAA